MKKIGKVKKVESLTRAGFYTNYILGDTPVIIKNYIAQWPAYNAWSFDDLSNKIGHINAKYSVSKSCLHPDLSRLATDPSSIDDLFHKTTISHFIRLLQSDSTNTYFLSGDELQIYRRKQYNPELSALFQDFEVPYLCNTKKLKNAGLWLSPKNIQTWLHYDKNGCHNLNAQIRGSKRILLFPPDNPANYYLHLYTDGDLANFSQVNIAQPDYDQFPSFRTVHYYEATLYEGELLYIPAYWLHSFEHLGETNINLNFWWEENTKLSHPLHLRKKFFDSIKKTLLKKQDPLLQARLKDIELHLLAS